MTHFSGRKEEHYLQLWRIIGQKRPVSTPPAVTTTTANRPAIAEPSQATFGRTPSGSDVSGRKTEK